MSEMNPDNDSATDNANRCNNNRNNSRSSGTVNCPVSRIPQGVSTGQHRSSCPTSGGLRANSERPLTSRKTSVIPMISQVAAQADVVEMDEGLGDIPGCDRSQPMDATPSTLFTLADKDFYPRNFSEQEVIAAMQSQASSASSPDGAGLPGQNLDFASVVELPSLEVRKRTLAVVTSTWGIQPSVIESVASMTSGFSAADLAALCSTAASKALGRTHPSFAASDDNSSPSLDVTSIMVTTDDFEAAMRIFQPTNQRLRNQ